MGDKDAALPDQVCLFDIASEQRGYFTAAQARVCGFGWELLRYHTQNGRFIRIRRGLYRLRDYPTSPREEVMAAWLAVGKNSAVVSHASALDLLDLSDVIPDAIHLTVPRSRRHLPVLAGVTIHTTTKPLHSHDITVRDGIRLTAPTRTILDAADVGVAPDQIELAVVRAFERGLIIPRDLEKEARDRGRRVARLIAGALRQVAP